ncbi:Arginine/serine-rich splicing factor scl25a transcript I [Entomortierella lignicola]|nr:Arginine/serine-rich splicing factor scl25a transcript I [Entomortierella lignicola]KAF9209010.1 Arginine/serine-rich splicing factor scl25a transcript I [Haplosporangium sp. Z 27]
MPRDRNDNSVSLHVSGFKDNTRPSDLASLFEPHGRISDDYYTGLSRGFAYIQYHDEEDARRVFESGEQFSLDGRKLEIQYAQGRRKTPNQMRGQGGRGDRRRSRSADRHYRPSSRRYSRSRSRSRSPVRRRRDSRSPVRRGRSRSRSPPRRSSRRSPSPRRPSRSRSPRGRSTSRDRFSRSRSPRRSRGRYTPSPERGPKGNSDLQPFAPDNRPEQGEIAEQGEFVEY